MRLPPMAVFAYKDELITKRETSCVISRDPKHNVHKSTKTIFFFHISSGDWIRKKST